MANNSNVTERVPASTVLFNISEELNNTLLRYSMELKDACNVTKNYTECLEIEVISRPSGRLSTLFRNLEKT